MTRGDRPAGKWLILRWTVSVLKDYAPFSGPSDRFSYDLVMDGPEKGKCRSIISISLINCDLANSSSDFIT